MIAKLFKRSVVSLFTQTKYHHLMKMGPLSVPMRCFVKDEVEDPKNVSKKAGFDLAKNKQNTVAMWEQAQANQKNALILQDKQQIQQYVLSMVRGYFRTTQKGFLSLESNLTDHGLDSMDVVQLVIQVQDDLGFIIDAENLTRFEKPKHFVNYISQLEAYKREFHRYPQQGSTVNTSLTENFQILGKVKSMLNREKSKKK